MRNNKGITLVTLVVSIIIMLILAGVSINGVLNTNTIDMAREVAFKSEAQDIKDAWEARIIGIDATYLDYSDISKALGVSNIGEDMRNKLEIQNGELVYKDDMCTNEEKLWFESLGIHGAVSFVASVKTNINIVGSDIENVTKDQAMDVILVLDVSGSMEYTDDGVKRSSKMTNVINNTMKQILESNPNNRVGIVTFSGSASTFLNLDHYKSKDADGNFLTYSSGAISSYTRVNTGSNWRPSYTYTYLMQDSNGNDVSTTIDVTGGTYTQSGMMKAYEILNERTDAKNLPAIILITDGLPTYYAKLNTSTKKLGSSQGNGSETTQNHGYYNIQTASWIKKQIQDIRMYNIGIAEFEGADGAFMNLTLNPTLENYTAARNYTGSNGEDITKTELVDLAKYINGENGSYAALTDYYYANGFAIGALSEEDLNTWFKSVIEDIQNNLQKGGLTIGNNNNITGIYEVDSDSMTYTTKIDPATGKTEDGSDIEGTYEFRLADNANLTIQVSAAAFTTSADGTSLDMIVGSEYTTPVKRFSVQDIKNGVEPNLYYLEGQIKWNVRSEYKDGDGLAKDAITAVEANYPDENIEVEITEIVIELPVITTKFTPAETSE